MLETIARCAQLLALMRTPYDKEAQANPESPHRANAVLYNLARGRALTCGRTQLTVDDLPMVAQIAISSMSEKRRTVLLAFAKNEGESITVKQVENAVGRSRHTAESYMAEMEWLGFASFQTPGNGSASFLSINPDWVWSMEEEFRSLLLSSELAEIGR